MHGSRVEVRDLFYATPARLKFLKSERSEALAISDVVKRLAMANPAVGMTLGNAARTTLKVARQSDSPSKTACSTERCAGPIRISSPVTVTLLSRFISTCPATMWM